MHIPKIQNMYEMFFRRANLDYVKENKPTVCLPLLAV